MQTSALLSLPELMELQASSHTKMESDPKLSIELIWEDVDLEDLCITASNGRYCGTTRVYFAQGDIAALAKTIQGFPKDVSQVEVFEGGQADGARAKLVFRCIDQLGHASVRVSLVEFAFDNAQLAIMNDVNLEMRFEAWALDQFCKELEGVGKRVVSQFEILIDNAEGVR